MNEEQKKKEERMGNKRKKEQTLIGKMRKEMVWEKGRKWKKGNPNKDCERRRH